MNRWRIWTCSKTWMFTSTTPLKVYRCSKIFLLMITIASISLIRSSLKSIKVIPPLLWFTGLSHFRSSFWREFSLSLITLIRRPFLCFLHCSLKPCCITSPVLFRKHFLPFSFVMPTLSESSHSIEITALYKQRIEGRQLLNPPTPQNFNSKGMLLFGSAIAFLNNSSSNDSLP